MDFIWTGPQHTVGIEVKASSHWRRGDGAALADLHARKVIQKAFAV